jgi:predicted nucleic acid-binding protein
VSLLLDTNVVSELRKDRRMNTNVRRWFESVADKDLHLSVLVLGELRRGIEQVRARDTRQAVALERWLVKLVADHADRLLPVDRRVADVWGLFSSRRSGSPIDLLMAATARVHGLVLVTRKVRDVAWTGVPHLNPFEPSAR